MPERGKYPVIFTPNNEYTGEVVDSGVRYRRSHGAGGLPAEARPQPRQVARPLRAAAAGSVPGVDPALGGVDRAMASKSTSAAAWVATASRATATDPRLHSCRRIGRATSPWVCSSSGSRPRARCPTTATSCAPSREGCAARPCQPGTSCWTGTGFAVIQYVKYELAADRSDPAKPYFYFVEEPPKPPIYIGTAAGTVDAAGRARQERLARRQVLGVPRRGGKGDGAEGAGAEGRLRASRFRPPI